jgi:hypothetical protein
MPTTPAPLYIITRGSGMPEHGVGVYNVLS